LKNKIGEDFRDVFNKLRTILKHYEGYLKITSDNTDTYNLNAGYSEKYKREIYFGGVQVKKNYVSFYLMPVYINPELLKNISTELKKRMQGKSCFNFKTVDKEILEELRKLTKSGFTYYKKNGML
jgi:hypothetical protein